jgi:hypothetical protein
MLMTGWWHCRTENEAEALRAELQARLEVCGLQMHPTKTQIVYCKDNKRRGTYPNVKFDFLGYQFRPPPVATAQRNEFFCGYTPAVSPAALKSMRTAIRNLRIPRQTPGTLVEIARQINPLLRAWIGYYGRFSRSGLAPLVDYVNQKVKAWIMRKYKLLRFHKTRARCSYGSSPGTMWNSSYTGNHPERLRSPDRSGVNREVHAPLCERPEVKLHRPTQPSVNTNMIRLFGRAPRGERVIGRVPFGAWKTVTFVAALRHDGMTAPMMIEGAMNG